MAPLPFALQLYSVREALLANPADVLKRVKAMGYDHVELAGTASLAAPAFRELLNDAGLRAISAHVNFDDCCEHLGAVLADSRALGVQWAVVPWLDPARHPTLAEWSESARALAKFSVAFREAGITLCYHNHTAEFDSIDGISIFEHLLSTVGPEALAIELDVGWSHYAGADTPGLLTHYAGRIPLLHVKDVKARVAGEAPVHTELGNGATPLGRILPAAARAGVQWLIVEQDESARDPMESARMNAAYMRVHVY